MSRLASDGVCWLSSLTAVSMPRGRLVSAAAPPRWRLVGAAAPRVDGASRRPDGSESHAARRKACVERRVPGGVLFATGAGACICYPSSSTMEVTGRYGPGDHDVTTRRVPAMGHYKSNLRDLEFNLFEVFGRQDVLGTRPLRRRRRRHRQGDAQGGRAPRRERAGRVASPTPTATRRSTTRKTHSVTMPDSFKKSLQAYVDSGFWGIDVPARARRHRRPAVACAGPMNEMVLRRQPGHRACSPRRYSFAKLLHILGNDEQKKLARWIVEKGWHCTMVLTEPDAGSDVGAGRTKAVQNADGTWNVTGVKRFITSGRVRHGRQRRALRARPPRGRRPRHQGPVPLHRAEVPRRPRDR